VDSFRTLLRHHADCKGLSLRELGRRAGCSPALPGLVATGKRRPPREQIGRWAEVLGLTGAERAAFREAALLAHAPEEVRDLVADLRRRLDREEDRAEVFRLRVADLGGNTRYRAGRRNR